MSAMLTLIVLSLLTIGFAYCGESNLRERLAKIKFEDNDGPLLARIETKLPDYSDIYCEPTEGRIG